MNLAVIGLGKLGAPLAAVAAAAGHKVIGADISTRIVREINERRAPVNEPGLAQLIASLPPGQLSATTDPGYATAMSEMTIVIVPTPSDDAGAFRTDLIQHVLRLIGPEMRGDWHTVVIASTVMPGDTNKILLPEIVAASGRTLGRDLGVVFSPEFIALGSVIQDMRGADMILIGSDEPRGAKIYGQYVASIAISSPQVMVSIHEAEIAKLAINTYLTVKISYANMLAEVCVKAGVDPWRVAKAVGVDSRIGKKFLMPGGPFGGPCLPRDTGAFRMAAKRVGVETPMTVAAEAVNRRCVQSIVEQVEATPSVTRIAILGLTYKPDTDVTEGSFGLMVEQALANSTRSVCCHDPRVHPERSAQKVIDQAECVIITTPWPEYRTLNYEGRKVIDVWGLLR